VADSSGGVLAADLAARYAAFMSYSHALDGALAPALQTSLEQFGRVWYRRQALRLFRDTTNLTATPHLWDSIEQALRSSEWFILLASPNSARSTWVRREIDWWLANRSPARLIIAVTAGSVAWDEGTGRVDEQQTDALPPAFAAYGLPEPLWVDLRLLRAAEPTDPAYQAAVVDIAATLHGRSKDDLVGEHIRQHRKRRRSIAIAAVALVLLTLISIITAGVAVNQRDRAEEQTRIAIARQLLTQSQAAIISDPRTALLLGEAAQHIHSSPEIRSSLAQIVRSTRYAGALGHTDSVMSVAFAPDRRTLATPSGDNTVILWDLSDPARPQRIGQPLTGHTAGVNSVAFAPDGRTLATAGGDNTVILWDLSDAARPQRIGQPLTGAVDSVAFAPDGRTLATAGGDNTVILWDLADPARPQRIGQPLTDHTAAVNSVAFAPDGRTLATASVDRSVILWDLADPARPQRIGQPLSDHTDVVMSVAYAPDGRTLATAGRDNTVILWDLSDRTRPQRIGQPLTDHTSVVASVAFAPDGRTLATASWDNTGILWDLTGLLFVRDHALQLACVRTGGALDRDQWTQFVEGLSYEDSCAAA
jgi:hypothetical protein